MKAYYEDARVTIYCGRAQEIVPSLDVAIDAVITDPPYGETCLKWDRWPDGWPAIIPATVRTLWCFGSLRLFMEKGAQFEGWKLAQDVVWEKHNGSSLTADRFRRVHELAAMFYRGAWKTLYRSPVKVPGRFRDAMPLNRRGRPAHFGGVEKGGNYLYGETRLMRSVISVASCHYKAIHPTQKPEGIVLPLLEYSVPAGGVVLDLFMGSGTVLAAAKQSGRRAIGIDSHEPYCERAARRLSQEMAL